MGTREIVRLLWPSDCQLRHVSVSYLRETLQACTSTVTRQNAKLHGPAHPPLGCLASLSTEPRQ